jgi:hypothetical protein
VIYRALGMEGQETIQCFPGARETTRLFLACWEDKIWFRAVGKEWKTTAVRQQDQRTQANFWRGILPS